MNKLISTQIKNFLDFKNSIKRVKNNPLINWKKIFASLYTCVIPLIFKLRFIYFILYLSVFLNVCMCTMCAFGIHEGEKKALDPLGPCGC